MADILVVEAAPTAKVSEYTGSNNFGPHTGLKRHIVADSDKDTLAVVDPVAGTSETLMREDGNLTTLGTVEAEKPVIADSNLDVTGIRNLTLTGAINSVPIAELTALDPSQVCTWFTDFLAADVPGEFTSTAGSGTGNEAATTVAGAVNGAITLSSASDDGAITANATNLTFDQLNYRADQGGLAMEARISIDDISEAYLFVGFTDVIGSTLEAPIYLTGADAIDSDATNACGMVYDVDAATAEFAVGGVAGDTDTAPTFAGSAPVDATNFIVRVEVSAAGAVTVYIDGTSIGTVASAVTITTPLTPAIVVANRSANQVIATVDYLWVQQNR